MQTEQKKSVNENKINSSPQFTATMFYVSNQFSLKTIFPFSPLSHTLSLFSLMTSVCVRDPVTYSVLKENKRIESTILSNWYATIIWLTTSMTYT